MRSITHDEFITCAKSIHGDKYDYSQTKFINKTTLIKVSDNIHGTFEILPFKHLLYDGYSNHYLNRFSNEYKKHFIEVCKLVHNNKYDYSKSVYIQAETNMLITCPIHGDFYQLPTSHINGKGCNKCGDISMAQKHAYTTEEFINKSKQIHGNKYDYSKVHYISNKYKVIIGCPIHGDFLQSPDKHLSGCGCRKCADVYTANVRRKTTEWFITKAIQIHGMRYDYSKANYTGICNKIEIICNEHGSFFQSPRKHLLGHGCPKCVSYKLENTISLLLDNNNIKYNKNYKEFKWLINDINHSLELDFYIPEYNIAIECQGKQHFEPVEKFGGTEAYQIQVKNDQIKQTLCKQHNIKLCYFCDKYNYINNYKLGYLTYKAEDLLEYIKFHLVV